MPIVTYESVAEAAHELESKGSRASVRNVMSALGGGSPNQIAPLLRQYQTSKTVVEKPKIPLDPKIQELIVRQIESVAAEAAKAADERAADATSDLELLAEIGKVMELRVQELLGELDEARGKAAQDVAAITLERDKAETLAAERQTEITRLTEAVAREQAAAETARIETAKAQLTVDQQTKQLEIKDESLKTTKNELDAVRVAKDEAERGLAVVQALAKVAEQSILEEKQKNLDLRKQVDDLRAEKDLLRDDCNKRVQDILDQANARDQVAQARIESLEKALVEERGKASAAAAAEKAAKSQVEDLQRRLDKAEDGLDKAREHYRTLIEDLNANLKKPESEPEKKSAASTTTNAKKGTGQN